MRIVRCEQGTEEWQDARLGIPTASQFHRLITPKTMKPSAARRGYLVELAAEWLLGCPLDVASSAFMDRGKALEPEAATWYEIATGEDTEAVGLCLLDSGAAGASPDRLVGDDGLLEIKCHGAKEHVAALLGDKDHDHRCQVQGQLWVTGRAWCDLLYYSPRLPSKIERHERDEEFIGALSEIVAAFCSELTAAKWRLEELKR